MSTKPYILLDFDDTISHQIPFNLQYVRAIGAILAPVYGGETEAWAKAAIDMMEALENEYLARFRDEPRNGYCEWLDGMHTRAAALLFTGMGLALPSEPPQFAKQTRFAALTHCNALFPGVEDALRTLSAQGYRVQMASGNDSEHLQASLRGAGLEDWIGSRFGPDLIDCAKEGPEFYERLFAKLSIDGSEAVVVDNDPLALRWAMQQGATGIQAALAPEYSTPIAAGVAGVLTDFADLPALLQRL